MSPKSKDDKEFKIEVTRMTKEEEEEFDFWSDMVRSDIDGEIPMIYGWPKEFPEQLARTVGFAADRHHWKARKGTYIPYMSHLLAVASLVYEMGGKPDEVKAAILHDVVEDTGTTLEEVAALAGPHVAEIVKACSDSLTPQERDLHWVTREAKTLAKMKTASSSVLQVMLADKLHNARCLVRDLNTYSPETVWRRFSGKASQIANYYQQIATIMEERIKSEGEIFGAYAKELKNLSRLISEFAKPEEAKEAQGRLEKHKERERKSELISELKKLPMAERHRRLKEIEDENPYLAEELRRHKPHLF